jgi:hypothetical protein
MKATLRHALGLATAWAAFAGASSWGATSFSNSLKGFTGNSTQPATQTAVTAAGFNFSNSQGAQEDPPGTQIDPTIVFSSSGATFGSLFSGNEGRNYMRTVQSDYATTSFVAEISIEVVDMDLQDVYFGLGSGTANPGLFYTPDWGTPVSSVMYWGESEDIGSIDPPPTLDVFRTYDRNELDVYTPIPDLPPDGTHRIRITFDRYARTFVLGFDINYAGGAFAADVSTAPMDVSPLFNGTGWNTEPSRIFFGGDDGMVIKDFQVTVSGTAAKEGDFNGDNAITSADWVILRSKQHTNISGGTLEQAYFMGDLTGDKKNNHADFVKFKDIYDAVNGEGAFAAMVAAVPEPAAATLVMAACLIAAHRRRSRA